MPATQTWEHIVAAQSQLALVIEYAERQRLGPRWVRDQIALAKRTMETAARSLDGNHGNK